MVQNMAVGRPPGHEPIPQDLASQVIAWLVGGGSLMQWCEQEGHPHRSTVYDWATNDPDFARRFARARELGASALVDKAQRIADGDDREGEDVQRSKLRVDTLLKRAACYCPKVYGSKVQVGGDGGEPIRITDKTTATAEIAAILANAAQAIEKGER